jgi:phage replication-related protein YjqB (UPF0714/DUF867 family)
LNADRDAYCNFADLAARQEEGVDFRIVARYRNPRVAVIAPHGGGIEGGTSEIAAAIAGREFSLYTFEGLKDDGNNALHITSTHFDEPECQRLIALAEVVLAIHGCELPAHACEDPVEIVYVGGLDLVLAGRLLQALMDAGFAASGESNPAIGGCHTANICNRGATGRGCQMEISKGLRFGMFEGLDRAGRRRTRPKFEAFVRAARRALFHAEESLA